MEQLVKAIINQHHEVDMPVDAVIDIIKKDGEDAYHVLHLNQSFHVEVLSVDRKAKQVKFRINDVQYNIKYKDQVDVMVDEMGFSAVVGEQVSDAFAPMPGLVLSVDAQAGDTVVAGQPLLILEAMKMENVIKAAHDGTIKNVLVNDGDKVEKGQLLLTYEEA